MLNQDELLIKAKQKKAKIIFPEGAEKRILLAAHALRQNNIAEVAVIGDLNEITNIAEDNDIDLEGIEVISILNNEKLIPYAEHYLTKRPRSKLALAKKMMSKPLYFAAMMVEMADADLLVAGISHPTTKVIEAAGLCIGLSAESNLISSFFIMSFKDRSPLIFSDCAVNVEPNAEQLANITVDTAANYEKLFGEPARVALLSFSTKGSASHKQVDKVKECLSCLKQRAPKLNVEGELQADAAIVSTIAKQKLVDEGTVAGDANILIFPDLNAGNISYKLVQHLAHAEAIGPILQGFAKPVADLSRGASVAEIILTSTIALAIS